MILNKWDWHDARKEKPLQGQEVILFLDNGEQHAGHWLEHANKYVRNTRKWKVYKWDKYVPENEVVARRLL